MKKLGFLIACTLFAFTSSVHAMSIHIPNLTSYDFDNWDPVTGPAVSSHASIDVYFEQKADSNPDPLIYEFGNAFSKIDVHLNALVNGIWEDQSFSIESPTGSGSFRRDDTDIGWPTFFISGQGFSAFIHTVEFDSGFTILDVAARIHNYEYSSEEAYIDLSSTRVPEPSPFAILLVGLVATGFARANLKKQSSFQ